MASNIFDFELSAEKTYGSNNYKYSRSATVIKPKPYLLTSFTFYTGIEVNAGTYYVGLSSSSSYNGSNPNEFLDYGYKYVSVSSYDVLNTSFNLNYGKGMYNNLYCYIIKYSGTSKNIFSSSSSGATLIQNSGSFSFNIYKPAHADSISYNWNSKTFNSANGNSYSTISRTDIKYTDKLYVQVNYSSRKDPNNTVCIAKNNIAFKGQISTSETPGTKQILTINAYDICFYYKKSDGTGTQGGTGTKLELYSIINNPFTKKEGLVYNGSSQTGITGIDYLTTTIGFSSGTNAGTYTFKVTAKDGYYFSHSGNSSASTITMTWTISKQPWYIKDHCTLYNPTYNGSAQTILKYNGAETIPTGSSCGSTISLGYNSNGNSTNDETAAVFAETTSISRTDAGTYYLWGKAISLENPNYQINGATVYLGSATISKVNDSITWTNLITSTSKYATDSAKTADKTDSAKTIKISDGVKSTSGRAVSVVISNLINKSNGSYISNHGWTISTDFKTITIPANFACGSYTCIINYSVPAGTNYNAYSSSSSISVDINAVTLSNGNYSPSDSGWYAKISIGSGITAAGGSATITASAGHTHYYYEHYSNGANSSQKSKAVNDGVSISIDSQTCAGGTNRFTLSGNDLIHNSMGTNVGEDKVTIIAKNNSNSEGRNTATKSVTNSKDSSVTGMNERKQSCYYSYTEYRIINFASVGDISAAGGSSYGQGTGQSRTCYNSSSYTKYDYYYLYTAYYHGDTNAKVFSHSNTADGCKDGDAPGPDSWGGDTTVKGSKFSALSLGTTEKSRTYIGTSTVDWNGKTASADIYQTANSKDSSVTAYNQRTQNCYQPYTDYRIINFNPVGVIPAGGGSSYGQGTGQSRTCYNSSNYEKYDYYYRYSAYYAGDASAMIFSHSNTKSGWEDGATPGCGSWGDVETVTGSTISASALGTTVREKTKVGTSSVTWHSVSADVSIYQAANSRTTVWDDMVWATPTVVFSNNSISAGGGSLVATATFSENNKRYYHYTYTDSSANESANAHIDSNYSTPDYGMYMSTPSHEDGWDNTNTWKCTGTWTSSLTVEHRNMAKDVTTDSANITAYNASANSAGVLKANTKTISVTNSVGAWSNTTVYSYGTPSLTLANNLTAGGGSVTVTCSVTDTYNRKRTYTSGSYDTDTNGSAAGTACWRITSNGNNRFGYSGTAHTHSSTNYYYSDTTATHSSMTSNVGTDTVGITAYNHGDLSKKSSEKTAAVSNSLQSTKYKSKSTSDKGFNATYGTPTISIGNGITAGGGSAAISASVTNTAKWYQIYDSGTWTGEQSSSNGSVISNAVSLSITSQYIATSSNADSGTTITRFSISGTTLKHSSMDKSTGWDTVNVKVTNDASTGKTATARTYVQNTVSAWKNTTVYAYGTPTKVTFSVSSNESRCAGGNTTMSATVTDTYSRKRTYTSGSVDTDTNGTAAGTVGYEFVSRTCNDGSDATSYWGINGSTLTHRNMGTKWVTDYCVVRAYNAGSSTIKGANSDELSASNGRSEVNIKYYASCSISNGITASGGSATVSYRGYHTANYKYASGTTDSSLHETNDGATIKITSQSCAGGTNRFSLSGSTLSHTNMGTTTGTDSVTITATNSANSTGTTTASKSVTNSLESISIVLGSSAVSKPGGDATGHPSSSHYDLAYNSTTSPTVTATYTSGSTANVTSSSTFKSSDTTVATIS